MNTQLISINNVKHGQCYSTDHTTEKIVIEIDSLSGVSLDKLKNLIQQQYKVVSIKTEERKIFVK